MDKNRPWLNKLEEYSNEYIDVYEDIFAVTPNHLLFVPVKDTREYVVMAFQMAQMLGDAWLLQKKCTGYNIGLNRGKSAGQTCEWSHVHLIPRTDGDCEDPTGGVRGVIPLRQNYKTSPLYAEVRKILEEKNENTNN